MNNSSIYFMNNVSIIPLLGEHNHSTNAYRQQHSSYHQVLNPHVKNYTLNANVENVENTEKYFFSNGFFMLGLASFSAVTLGAIFYKVYYTSLRSYTLVNTILSVVTLNLAHALLRPIEAKIYHQTTVQRSEEGTDRPVLFKKMSFIPVTRKNVFCFRNNSADLFFPILGYNFFFLLSIYSEKYRIPIERKFKRLNAKFMTALRCFQLGS